jgi:hypothetical protein
LPAVRRGDSTASASAPASMSTSTSASAAASSPVSNSASASAAAAPSASLAEAEAGSAAGKPAVFVTPIQKALAERMPAPVDRAAFVNDTLARADEALAHAWALRRLADRYEPRDVTALSRRSSQSLATLVDDHTAALRTAVDVLITRVTPLVAAAEALDAQSGATRGGSAGASAGAGEGTGASREQERQQRLSMMELFTLVNGWHTDAHALLAASSADRPDALRLNPREWLIRLHQIRDALKQSAFPM